MKGRIVALDHLFGAEAAALLVDGQLQDLIVDASAPAGFAPGAVLRARVGRLLKGQGGVFVDLPDGARGYLRDRSHLREGQTLVVQVSGVAEPGKAIPVTGRLLFRGRYGIVTPDAPGVNVSRRIRDEDLRAHLIDLGQQALGDLGAGLIVRSAAADASDADILDDLTPLVQIARGIAAEGEGRPELLLAAPTPWEQAWTEWAEPAPDEVMQGDDSFEHCGLREAVDALLTPRLALPGGASAMIEATRALIAIDVNTGADTSPAAGLKANIALARDLPRQLRLRGLGGQIVVDFAPVPKRDRATLDQVLRAAFRGESTETTLIGWTAMGLYEINRKRDRIPLTQMAAAEEA